MADTSPAHPDDVVAVLLRVLWRADSWTELFTGGWLLHGPTDLYLDPVPGYRAGRFFALAERFVRWLARRGEIDAWGERALISCIDESRESHGLRPPDRPRVADLQLVEAERDPHVRAFAAALEDPFLSELAVSAIRTLCGAITAAHGPARRVPVGLLDAEWCVRRWLDSPEAAADLATRDLFLIVSAFYRWTGDTGRLHPPRARALASRFAAAAMSVTAAMRSGGRAA